MTNYVDDQQLQRATLQRGKAQLIVPRRVRRALTDGEAEAVLAELDRVDALTRAHLRVESGMIVLYIDGKPDTNFGYGCTGQQIIERIEALAERWVPAEPMPEPRIWRLWRRLGLMR